MHYVVWEEVGLLSETQETLHVAEAGRHENETGNEQWELTGGVPQRETENGGDAKRKPGDFRGRHIGEIRLESFHLRREVTSFYNMVNQEKGQQGQKPVMALSIIIT